MRGEPLEMLEGKLELATGIEPATCGVQNPSDTEDDTPSNLLPNNEPDDLEQDSE